MSGTNGAAAILLKHLSFVNRGKGTDCKGSIFLPDAGSGAWPAFDGCANVRDAEIVSVTINYRLGVLGFLGLPALSAANSSNGNWGLMVSLPGQGLLAGQEDKTTWQWLAGYCRCRASLPLLSGTC